VKFISSTGYDTMTIVAEDRNWLERLFRRPPRKRTFKGEGLYWEENKEPVNAALCQTLGKWWSRARAEADARRNQARGK
jgi:hypothetical protein